ncbi:MAG: lysylphosphatidylglycerol synthase transmembrane domain-containing protein [Chloroflexota bacterium]|nr:lysylphosphatidylglycerol synthase transmembrane domain-containing protein [Chloroflexota bacterium]MDE2885873.1 lysylphosphatidylglycerol synthase transmembrane domain-containing protein [Chloroflexota bacterium]
MPSWAQPALRLSRNKWAQAAFGVVASGSLAYLAAHNIVWKEVADAFLEFPPELALLALVPLAAAIAFRASRWYVLLRGEPVSFRQVLLTQNTGLGLNNLSPVRMVSEPVQLAMINRRYAVPFPRAFATLVGENVLDIFTTALMMGLGVLLSPGVRASNANIQLIGAFIMFIVSALILVAVVRGAVPWQNRFSFLQRIIEGFTELKEQPARLWLSLGVNIVHWLLLGLTGWVLGRGLGIDVPPVTMATILVAATFFTSAVPSVPSGVGTYHFAVVTMLTESGADQAAALNFALMMHLLIVLPPTAIALLMTGGMGLGTLRNPSSAPQGASGE